MNKIALLLCVCVCSGPACAKPIRAKNYIDTISVAKEKSAVDYLALVRKAESGGVGAIKWMLLLGMYGGFDGASKIGHDDVMYKIFSSQNIAFFQAYTELPDIVKKSVKGDLKHQYKLNVENGVSWEVKFKKLQNRFSNMNSRANQ